MGAIEVAGAPGPVLMSHDSEGDYYTVTSFPSKSVLKKG
jgi:hypothetical protein